MFFSFLQANQKIPPVLTSLEDPTVGLKEVDSIKGCGYCGGLGHRVLDCPKLLQVNKSKNAGSYQYDSVDEFSSM